MVQILEEAPGIGSRFAQGIGKGLSGESNSLVSQFGQMMQQRREQQMQAQDLAQADKLLEENYGIKLGGIKDPKVRQSIIEEELKGINQRKLVELKSEGKGKGNKEIVQKNFNRLYELIPKVGKMESIFSPFGGEASKNFGEFKSLTGALESELVDMVSRGTLSNSRFKYITETLLPRPNDTQSEIEGKLKGLAQMLELNIPSQKKEDSTKKSENTLESELKRRGLI